MKRILALHGHSQSAPSFKYKLRAIQDACKGSIEFVFVDAPHTLAPVDFSGAPPSDSSTMDINGYPARAWWRFLYDMRDVSTVIESFNHIRTVLETQGPFQGIFGFSQGAAFAAMILAFMESSDLDQNLLRNVKHPAFEFAVMVSGFVAPTQDFPLPPQIRTPSLHIMGLNDIMVAPEISAKLADRFETAQVEIHQGGHFIPRTRAWRSFFCEYLRSRASASGEVPDHIQAPTSPGYRKKLLGYHSARM
ncbi:FSH1-domain-containing protein [Mycena galericulata]|nr:FSH1-domain-containing protein [Mycena galericulata]